MRCTPTACPIYCTATQALEALGRDASDLIGHILRDITQSSIQVQMVTSEHDQNRAAAVQQTGVSAICAKPFEPSMVHGLVRQILTA